MCSAADTNKTATSRQHPLVTIKKRVQTNYAGKRQRVAPHLTFLDHDDFFDRIAIRRDERHRHPFVREENQVKALLHITALSTLVNGSTYHKQLYISLCFHQHHQ